MTWLIERLVELDRHLTHIEMLKPRVEVPGALARDQSLQNDTLFSLLMICQLVIDIAGELAARNKTSFEDYRGAIRALEQSGKFPPAMIRRLERMPGFRNVLIHEYVRFDLERAVEALADIETVREFALIVRSFLDDRSEL